MIFTLSASSGGRTVWDRLACTILCGVLVLFHVLTLDAQDARGSAGFRPSGFGGTTRAVVVGISDYQHPDIPDLQFADRDAEAFARMLTTGILGPIDSYNLRLLVNGMATAGAIETSFDWAGETSQAGDRILIYFAGHGDQEADGGPDGFLLAHDACHGQYTSGGTIRFSLLRTLCQQWVDQGIAPMLILDACRAGQIAGLAEGGPGMLHRLFEDSLQSETRLLACGPDEKSFEDLSWGNGHGAFTWSLLRGILGKADQDNDDILTYHDLKTYLETEVPVETERQQHPRILTPDWNWESELLQIDGKIHPDSILGDVGSFPLYPKLTDRGMDNLILSIRDTSIADCWSAMIQAIEDGVLLDSADRYGAEHFYQCLSGRKELSRPIQIYIRNTFIAALLDQGQQAMLAILQADRHVISGGMEKLSLYKHYPEYYHQAAMMLGEKHRLYSPVLARESLFKGMLSLWTNIRSKDSLHISEVMGHFSNALSLDPHLALAWYYRSICEGEMKDDPDASENSARRANQLVPNWTVPLSHMAYMLVSNANRDYRNYDKLTLFNRAISLLDTAFSINSNEVITRMALGALYHYWGNKPKASETYRQVLSLDSTYSLAWVNLGASLLDQDSLDKAEEAFLKALAINSTDGSAYHGLGCTYRNKGDLQKAEDYYLKALEYTPRLTTMDSLAIAYLLSKQYDKAIYYCQNILSIDKSRTQTRINLSRAHALNRDNHAALREITALLKEDIKPEVLLRYPELKPLISD